MKKILILFTLLILIVLSCLILSSCDENIDNNGNTNQTVPIEISLIGEWNVKTYSKESRLYFENEANILNATWTVYNYSNNKWYESSFVVKEIDNFTMTILLSDGTIDYIPFAISKDTLYFDGLPHTNASKNVIPHYNFETYVKDGVISPVRDNVFFGMTKTEVNRFTSLSKKYSWSDNYYKLPKDFYTDLDGETRYSYDSNGYLNKIAYCFEYDVNNPSLTTELIDDTKSLYDKIYERILIYNWSATSAISYVWTSHNIYIELYENKTTGDIEIIYSTYNHTINFA